MIARGVFFLKRIVFASEHARPRAPGYINRRERRGVFYPCAIDVVWVFIRDDQNIAHFGDHRIIL